MKLTYTMKELCKATGLGRTFLYQKIAEGRLIRIEGRLIRIKVGTRTLIPAASVQAFIESHAAPSSGDCV